VRADASPSRRGRGSRLTVTLLLGVLACVQVDEPKRVQVTTDTAGGSGGRDVPLELMGPGGAALLVPVRVNGRGPYDLILDTGATMTCLSQALADSLQLPEPVGQIGGGVTLGGGAGAVRLVSIDSLRVGPASATGLTGCVLDLSPLQAAGVSADGLLGLNFLKSFRVTLDFEGGRLLLEEPQ
jgi:predicted aspartyl protease